MYLHLQTGIGTKSQQALKLQQEQNKQECKIRSREKKEAEELRMFEMKHFIGTFIGCLIRNLFCWLKMLAPELVNLKSALIYIIIPLTFPILQAFPPVH